MTKKSKAPKNENTTETKTDAKPKKATQLKLQADGMARKAIAEIDRAAEKYRAARNTRMEHTKLEKEAKTLLLDVVKKHGVKNYVYEDDDGEEEQVEYTAESKENVKVKKLKADDAGDEDE